MDTTINIPELKPGQCYLLICDVGDGEKTTYIKTENIDIVKRLLQEDHDKELIKEICSYDYKYFPDRETHSGKGPEYLFEITQKYWCIVVEFTKLREYHTTKMKNNKILNLESKLMEKAYAYRTISGKFSGYWACIKHDKKYSVLVGNEIGVIYEKDILCSRENDLLDAKIEALKEAISIIKPYDIDENI